MKFFPICILLGVVMSLGLVTTSISYAQEGLAEYLSIEDTDLASGDIIMLVDNEYKRANVEYSPNIVGIFTEEPAVAFGVSGKQTTQAVANSGTIMVNVTAQNGHIEQGDLVTSSEKPGVGIKSTKPGNVLGVARESFNPEDPDTIGQIPVTIKIHFASTSMDDPSLEKSLAEQISKALETGAVAAATEPNTAIRYLAAALIGIISLAFGFMSSARAANNGVTAIGRNPMARKTIILGITLNILITVIIAGSGLALSAYLLSG